MSAWSWIRILNAVSGGKKNGDPRESGTLVKTLASGTGTRYQELSESAARVDCISISRFSRKGFISEMH